MGSYNDAGYVYVAQVESGAIKIGASNDVQSRIAELQTGNHERISLIYQMEFPSLEIAYEVESIFHRRYADYNIRGEWFSKDASELILDIEAITNLAEVLYGVRVDINYHYSQERAYVGSATENARAYFMEDLSRLDEKPAVAVEALKGLAGKSVVYNVWGTMRKERDVNGQNA